MYHFYTLGSLLMLDLVDECANMGQQLNGELVASLNKLLRDLSCADAWRGSS